MTVLPKKQILRTWVTNDTYDGVLSSVVKMVSGSETGYICLSNVHMVVEGILEPSFNDIINSASMALPDGKPLGILMNLLYGTSQKRIAGPDLMLDIIRNAEANGLSVFFYGSTPEVIECMREKLSADFPSLKIAGMISPPFRPLTEAEDEAITMQIASATPHILFVSLGCPKQERWMASHIKKLNTVMVGVGAGFPFYTGHVSRAPGWMQRYCLEWLYRIYAEPRRLLKRYVITNSIFLILGLCQLLFLKSLGILKRINLFFTTNQCKE